MPDQPEVGALGAFLKALRAERIDCILIGMMAAVEQGAPLLTVDYDFWINLPERQYVRLIGIVHRLRGTVLARTLYELSDGTQVNAIFRVDGLQSFAAEARRCGLVRLDGAPIKVLPLSRVIASKRASNRDKDVAVLPILERTLRLSRRLKQKNY